MKAWDSKKKCTTKLVQKKGRKSKERGDSKNKKSKEKIQAIKAKLKTK